MHDLYMIVYAPICRGCRAADVSGGCVELIDDVNMTQEPC